MGGLLLVALTHTLLLANFGGLFENLRRLVRAVFPVLVELEGLQETPNCEKKKQQRYTTVSRLTMHERFKIRRHLCLKCHLLF